MIAVWLSDTVTHFRQGDSSQAPPDVALTHASAPPDVVPQPCHLVDPPSVTS